MLTIVIRGNIQVLKVLAPGARRGPPAEARQLYELLSPPVGKQPDAGERARGAGRPSKRERRLIDRFTDKSDSQAPGRAKHLWHQISGRNGARPAAGRMTGGKQLRRA